MSMRNWEHDKMYLNHPGKLSKVFRIARYWLDQACLLNAECIHNRVRISTLSERNRELEREIQRQSEALKENRVVTTMRIDCDGRDVTDLPGLWSESDEIVRKQ